MSCIETEVMISLFFQILYNRGSLVELLISSDVSKYCEFRCITRVLTMLKDKLEVVNIFS